MAGRLKATADSANATSEKLLNLELGPSTTTATRTVGTGDQSLAARPFDRVWSLRPDADDKEVIDFSAWAAILLHLMVHKAYCVLYRPLFSDQSMSGSEVIRAK